MCELVRVQFCACLLSIEYIDLAEQSLQALVPSLPPISRTVACSPLPRPSAPAPLPLPHAFTPSLPPSRPPSALPPALPPYLPSARPPSAPACPPTRAPGELRGIQALQKLSTDHAVAILNCRGLPAVLMFLDFFSTGIQRIAAVRTRPQRVATRHGALQRSGTVSQSSAATLCCADARIRTPQRVQATAANLCNGVPADCFGLVEEAFPNLAELVRRGGPLRLLLWPIRDDRCLWAQTNRA
jgi:hypothetical protein